NSVPFDTRSVGSCAENRIEIPPRPPAGPTLWGGGRRRKPASEDATRPRYDAGSMRRLARAPGGGGEMSAASADGRREIPGVDVERLGAWMDAEGLPRGPIRGATLLGGGTQNILVRFSRGGRDWILRRPPLHKRANSDETMQREARVLSGLR